MVDMDVIGPISKKYGICVACGRRSIKDLSKNICDQVHEVEHKKHLTDLLWKYGDIRVDDGYLCSVDERRLLSLEKKHRLFRESCQTTKSGFMTMASLGKQIIKQERPSNDKSVQDNTEIAQHNSIAVPSADKNNLEDTGSVQRNSTAITSSTGSAQRNSTAITGSTGITQHNSTAITSSTGITQHNSTAITGSTGITQHNSTAITSSTGITQHNSTAITGSGTTDVINSKDTGIAKDKKAVPGAGKIDKILLKDAGIAQRISTVHVVTSSEKIDKIILKETGISQSNNITVTGSEKTHKINLKDTGIAQRDNIAVTSSDKRDGNNPKNNEVRMEEHEGEMDDDDFEVIELFPEDKSDMMEVNAEHKTGVTKDVERTEQNGSESLREKGNVIKNNTAVFDETEIGMNTITFSLNQSQGGCTESKKRKVLGKSKKHDEGSQTEHRCICGDDTSRSKTQKKDKKEEVPKVMSLDVNVQGILKKLPTLLPRPSNVDKSPGDKPSEELKDNSNKPINSQSEMDMDIPSEKASNSPSKEAKSAPSEEPIDKKANNSTSKKAGKNPSKKASSSPSKKASSSPSKKASSSPSKKASSSPSKKASSSPSKKASSSPTEEAISICNKKANNSPSKKARSTPSEQAINLYTCSKKASKRPSKKASKHSSKRACRTPGEKAIMRLKKRPSKIPYKDGIVLSDEEASDDPSDDSCYEPSDDVNDEFSDNSSDIPRESNKRQSTPDLFEDHNYVRGKTPKDTPKENPKTEWDKIAHLKKCMASHHSKVRKIKMGQRRKLISVLPKSLINMRNCSVLHEKVPGVHKVAFK